jgi:hypothetical protein
MKKSITITITITQVESDRGIVRQRYAVHHTKKYIDKACGGIVVELDPPNTEKLLMKGAMSSSNANKVTAPAGMLARLRFDWEQVLEGRAEDIPDYEDEEGNDEGNDGDNEGATVVVSGDANKMKTIGRRKPKKFVYKSRRSMWDI